MSEWLFDVIGNGYSWWDGYLMEEWLYDMIGNGYLLVG